MRTVTCCYPAPCLTLAVLVSHLTTAAKMDLPPLVVDNGTGFVKVGYAGSNFPEHGTFNLSDNLASNLHPKSFPLSSAAPSSAPKNASANTSSKTSWSATKPKPCAPTSKLPNPWNTVSSKTGAT
ncbi:hypothetical protein FS749_000393 [Ceratobasidium sp. UAMH 11750]|nr:hypothetical protein FS749_000393 [Ceratobasidium sp. UAMH 11750]